MVYGPRDREVLKVFRLARFGVGPVFGDGTQELSAVHASDLAAALLAVAAAQAAVGATYYPAHPEVFTSAAFVRAVGRAAGRRVRVVRIPLPLGQLALAATGAAARAAGQATILNSDKANEFFQAAWTGDPARLARRHGLAGRARPRVRTCGHLAVVPECEVAVTEEASPGGRQSGDRCDQPAAGGPAAPGIPGFRVDRGAGAP